MSKILIYMYICEYLFQYKSMAYLMSVNYYQNNNPTHSLLLMWV